MFLLVVAEVEREGDDVPGDVCREARESLRGKFRGERLSMGSLVRWEAAGRGDLAQVGVVGVGRNRIAKAQAVGFLPNARRDVEVEIVRMLPAATLQATRSPTKPVGAKKTDLAACNTLVSQPVRFFGFLKSVRVCAL